MREMKSVSRLLAVFLILQTSIAQNNFPSAVRRGDTYIRAIPNSSESHHDHRSLSSFWSFFSFLHGPCHIGDHKCHSNKGAGNNGGQGGGSGSGSGGTGDNTTGNYDSSSSNSSGSNGNDDGSDNVNGSNASTTDNANASANGSGKSNGIADFFKSTEGKVTSITLAALAASVALGAMYMGSKNRNAGDTKHALSGVLKKRIGLFSRMANRSNCATCRPEFVENAVLEGSDKTSSADYRLA